MKQKIIVIPIVTFFLLLSVWNLLSEKNDFSESERRALAKFPKVGIEQIMDGTFAKGFDEYVVDHFVLRDTWRSVKTFVKTGILGQKDNNQIYIADGHISKMEYPMNPQMLKYASETFSKINEIYLQENKVYLAIIPDKNRYLAEKNGYLSFDYEIYTQQFKDQMNFADYIEIADLLEADDYYYTDTHWRQDKIVDVAQRLATKMGTKLAGEYEEHQMEEPFYGVYVGQSALKCESDTITYLENDAIRAAVLEGANAVYDMGKVKGPDPYEMFLSGNQPVISIKNIQNISGKRLIMFRDSFGSSIAPLFIEAYSEIVLVDLRYISSNMLGEYVDFEDADVLFLYSTMMLNQSLSMK